MRQNTFGDTIIDSTTDDIGEALSATPWKSDDLYATVMDGDDGHYFEIMTNEDGDIVLTSEEIFGTPDAAKKYLAGHVSDVQVL